MRFSEIAGFPRHYDDRKYPVRALLLVEARDFRDIERIIEDQTQARVIGHDLADDDRIYIHVACTTDAVRKRLESRWG